MIRPGQRGAAGIYILLLLAVVLFGFLVMAVDVGRLYAVQAELQTAADSAAVAAAASLVGTANAHTRAGEQVSAAFDNSTGNDNRFNLRTGPIGVSGSELFTEIITDFFSTLLDAQTNSSGGVSGADAKYVRVEVRAETPVLFTRFLSPDREPRQLVAAAAVAGLSSRVCTACGIDALALVAPDAEEEEHYGFVLGESYTLYLTPSQQRPNLPPCLAQAPLPLAGTLAAVEYVILNHLPSGPETGLEGELFRLGAAGMASTPGLDPPGSVVIGTAEAAKPELQGPDCQQATPAGRGFLCGLNTRFGVDPAGNACAVIPDVEDLAAPYSSDTDLGTSDALQDYATEYDGNLRRVLTVAVVDAADSLAVLGFRQFLFQNALGTTGVNAINPNPVNPMSFTGAVRAQYLGWPVPLRCGRIGGSCNVSFGVGRTVLH